MQNVVKWDSEQQHIYRPEGLCMVMVLARAELTIIRVAGVGLCFGLVLKAELIIQEIFCYC